MLRCLEIQLPWCLLEGGVVCKLFWCVTWAPQLFPPNFYLDFWQRDAIKKLHRVSCSCLQCPHRCTDNRRTLILKETNKFDDSQASSWVIRFSVIYVLLSLVSMKVVWKRLICCVKFNRFKVLELRNPTFCLEWIMFIVFIAVFFCHGSPQSSITNL